MAIELLKFFIVPNVEGTIIGLGEISSLYCKNEELSNPSTSKNV